MIWTIFGVHWPLGPNSPRPRLTHALNRPFSRRRICVPRLSSGWRTHGRRPRRPWPQLRRAHRNCGRKLNSGCKRPRIKPLRRQRKPATRQSGLRSSWQCPLWLQRWPHGWARSRVAQIATRVVSGRDLRAAAEKISATRPGFVCVSGQSLFISVPCKLGSAESWTPQPCAMQPRASDEIELGAATCRCSRTMYWLPSKDRWEYRSRALRITLADAEDGHARDQIDAWVSDYNTTRPHSSLGYPFLPN